MSISKTYTAQCSKVGSFSYANNFTLYVELNNRDGNSSSNQSYVDYNVYCQSSGSGSISANHSMFFQINGNTIINETVKVNVSSPNAYIPIANGTISVNHNSDGSKTIGFSASIQGTTYGVSSSLSGDFTLERIGRYANISNFIVYKRDETSVSVSYSVDASVDWAWYSADNGSSWNNLPTNNIITGLNAGTSYQFKVRVRRTDSQLISESITSTFSTYDYPKVSYAPNFTIGNSVKLTLYNPLSRSLKIYLKGANNSERFLTTTTQESVSVPGNTEWTEFWYSTIPGSKQGRYSVRIVCEALGKDNTFLAGTYSISGNEGPIFNDFEFYDSNSKTSRLTGNNGRIIIGYSDVTAYISSSNMAKAQNSASMRYYRMAIGDKSQNVYVDDTIRELNIPIEKVFSNKIDVYAVDNRENSTIVTKTGTAINYEDISINSVNAKRASSVGTAVTLSFVINLWNQNFGNITNSIKNIGYEYKLASEPDSSYVTGSTTLTYTVSGNKATGSVNIRGDLGADGFNASNSYTIRLFVSDELSSAKYVVTLGNGNPGIAFYKDKIAVGKKYNTSIGGAFQVAGNAYLDGDVFIENNKSVKGLFPVTLYDNSSGVDGMFFLSESAADFKCLEFFFSSNANTFGYTSSRIFNPNNKYINLNQMGGNQNNYLELYSAIKRIQNYTISTGDGKALSIQKDSIGGALYCAGWDNSSQILVYKVIGYK